MTQGTCWRALAVAWLLVPQPGRAELPCPLPLQAHPAIPATPGVAFTRDQGATVSWLVGGSATFWIDGAMQVDVLETRGKYRRVRDLLGRIGWVSEVDLRPAGCAWRVWTLPQVQADPPAVQVLGSARSRRPRG